MLDYFQVKSLEFQPRNAYKCPGKGKHCGLHTLALLSCEHLPVTYDSSESQSLMGVYPNSQLQADEMYTPRNLPHFLMNLQTGAPLGHRRTLTQILTWRGGSHWPPAVTEGGWHGFAHQATGERSIWQNHVFPPISIAIPAKELDELDF